MRVTEFNLKTALNAISKRRTEESRQADAEFQKSNRGRLDPTSAESRIQAAKQRETDLMAQLKYLRKQPKNALRDHRTAQIMNRLSELAAEQGDYSRAVTLAHDPERREMYRKIRKAIRRKDSENCTCPDDLLVDTAKKVEFKSPAIMTVDTIVTPDGAKRLDRCRKCQFMNAR